MPEAAGDNRESRDELAVLKRWLKLDQQRAALKKFLTNTETVLDDAALGACRTFQKPQLS